MTDELETDLKDLVVKHGLRRVQAGTDTHVFTIEEPSIWAEEDEHDRHPVVQIEEIDL